VLICVGTHAQHHLRQCPLPPSLDRPSKLAQHACSMFTLANWPPSAPTSASVEDDNLGVLVQPQRCHLWQHPLTTASGADKHGLTCIRSHKRARLGLCSRFVPVRSAGYLKVCLCSYPAGVVGQAMGHWISTQWQAGVTQAATGRTGVTKFKGEGWHWERTTRACEARCRTSQFDVAKGSSMWWVVVGVKWSSVARF
jgi:hypothetical protein